MGLWSHSRNQVPEGAGVGAFRSAGDTGRDTRQRKVTDAMAGWMKSQGVDTYQQEDEMNCGMASVCMVINFAKGDKLPSCIIADESKSYGDRAKYVRANKDNPTMRRVMPVMPHRQRVLGRVIRGATENQPGSGSAQSNLVKVLGGYGILSEIQETDLNLGGNWYFSKTKLKGILDGASKSLPVIIGLVDPPHFCVCIGHAWKMVGSNRYAIADPADGQLHTAGHVSESRLIFGSYDTNVDNLIVVTGLRSLSAVRRRI